MRSSAALIGNYSNGQSSPYQKKTNVQILVNRIEDRRTCMSLFKGIVLILFYALLLVFLTTRSSVLGYEINSLELDVRSAEIKQHDIESQISMKCSVPTIESIASSQLGMHMPEDKDLMLVYENGNLVSGSYNYSHYK